MSNPLCLYAITPEQLETLRDDPMKLQDIDEWIADGTRNYEEAYCGLGLTGDDNFSDLVPADGNLSNEDVMAELGMFVTYMTPENVRAVARKFADFQIENLELDSEITDMFEEEIVRDELPRLFEFYRAAAEGGRAVIGTCTV
jgi:hypothetical protein